MTPCACNCVTASCILCEWSLWQRDGVISLAEKLFAQCRSLPRPVLAFGVESIPRIRNRRASGRDDTFQKCLAISIELEPRIFRAILFSA